VEHRSQNANKANLENRHSCQATSNEASEMMNEGCPNDIASVCDATGYSGDESATPTPSGQF
jgi:hypothetical protein